MTLTLRWVGQRARDFSTSVDVHTHVAINYEKLGTCPKSLALQRVDNQYTPSRTMYN